MKYYAGIGSRETPEHILKLMRGVAVAMDDLGFVLRSGGAKGADSAFASGTANLEVLRPHHATMRAVQIAKRFHPAWHRCNKYVRKLHARNVQILFGVNVDKPVEFIVCWTPNGGVSGGTGQALRIAEYKKIPVYNMAIESDIQKLRDYVKEAKHATHTR